MPGPAVPRQQPGGPPGRPGAGAASAVPPALWNGPSTDSLPVADDWAWDDSNWDPAASLTAQEIAALAALDRAGQPADDWEDFPGDAALAEADAWPAFSQPGFGEDGLYPPPGTGPAEALPGLLPRRLGTGEGFDAGGAADRLPPGPVLAGLTAGKCAAGPGQASDDELAGLMMAWRRLASWAAAGELSAVAELCARREAQVAAGADPHLAEHVTDEVAMVLTLTSWAAGTLVDRAQGLARLPGTLAALAAGAIDVPKALVILGELGGLDGGHAARVEAAVLGQAAGWTTGELRRAARRQVIAADPGAARTRKEKAAKRARVERWSEDAGTAALAGRDLPPVGVLAADAHLTGWATRLKAAGVAGTLDQLRAQVYLALLNGQPPESLLPTAARGHPDPTDVAAHGGPATAGSPGAGVAAADRPAPAPRAGGLSATAGTSDAGVAGPDWSAPGPGPAAGPGGLSATAGTSDTGVAAADRPAPGPGAGGRTVRGSVNLVLPLSAWLGWSAAPGEVAGFGPLDAADSRALAAALARDPATRWCVTVTGSGGRAVAHGCATGGPGPPPIKASGPGESPRPPPPARFGPGRSPGLLPVRRFGPGSPGSLPVGRFGPGDSPGLLPVGRFGPGDSPGLLPVGRLGPGGSPGLPLPPGVRAWLARITLTWLETGACSHRRESPRYRPSRLLAHLIQVRQVTCTAPGCRRPATSCDFEHTIPYHQGGRSCECNGGPCCRHHHRAKQAAGWRLSQPRPGTFVWSTPHGRSYQTEPDAYPI